MFSDNEWIEMREIYNAARLHGIPYLKCQHKKNIDKIITEFKLVKTGINHADTPSSQATRILLANAREASANQLGK